MLLKVINIKKYILYVRCKMSGNNKEIWDSFIELEKKHNLFELVDKNGLYYWDLIRFYIYFKLLYKNQKDNLLSIKKESVFKKIMAKVRMLLDYFLLKFDFSNKEFLFYIASRDKINNKLFFDKNSKATSDLIPGYCKCIVESYNSRVSNSYFLPQIIFRRFFKYENYDFTELMKLLSNEFGELNFNGEELSNILNSYYADYKFFYGLLKRKNIQKVFITQNGIQKGLIKAAKDLNITSYEFQHGVVNKGHLAYHYPDIKYKKGQVILPDNILSLSDFWFKELHCPNVNILPIGNDYFYSPITKAEKSNMNVGITVISTDIFGEYLSNFIIKLKKNTRNDEMIYFKLHPNQFNEKVFYEDKFKDFHNVNVISNELSVGELLQKTDTLFTILSTAVYEALQAKKKVILLKRNPYLHLEHVFDHPNLYLVNNVEEFVEAKNKNINADINVEYFSPFNPKKVLEIL